MASRVRDTGGGRVRTVPTLWRALRLVWAAAPREMVYATALTLGSAALTALELLVGREVVAALTDETTDRDRLVGLLIALGALLTLTALATTATAELRMLLGQMVHRQALAEVLDIAGRAEPEQFEDPVFHDRLRRANLNAQRYSFEVVWGLIALANTLAVALAVMVVLLAVTPLLVPVAVLAALPVVVVNNLNARALYRTNYALTQDDRDRDYHQRILTGRDEASEVVAYGLRPFLRRRHDELFADRIERTRDVVRQRTLRSLLGSALTSLILVTALAVVVLLADDGRLDVADAATAVIGLLQLASRLRGVGNATSNVYEGVVFLGDVERFHQSLPARDEGATRVTMPKSVRHLAVEHLSYRYPAGENEVLHDVSFEVSTGQLVAVVGPNGSGKSTLAKLLCGLLTPTSGRIVVDGVDLASVDPEVARSHIAPVLQDVVHFRHSVADNIAFGDLSRRDDRAAIETAAKAAGADEFVPELPRGYDTRLGTEFDGGAELSVGQWQRLAIARAYFRDADILVLDEPSAPLDPRSEQDLVEALLRLAHGRIVVMVSHRYATVRRADKVLVLLDGSLTEQGTHDELVAAGGLYAELYRIQATPYSDGTGAPR